MTRPPLIQRPTLIDGAPAADLRPMVIDACRKGGALAGVVGGAAVGAVFAYFVPKVLDSALTVWRGRSLHGQPVELELDDEGDDE